MADVEWMFGDVATGAFGVHALAGWNPLRWSGSLGFKAAIEDIENHTCEGQRPIDVKIPSGQSTKSERFGTPEEAIAYIKSKDPEQLESRIRLASEEEKPHIRKKDAENKRAEAATCDSVLTVAEATLKATKEEHDKALKDIEKLTAAHAAASARRAYAQVKSESEWRKLGFETIAAPVEMETCEGNPWQQSFNSCRAELADAERDAQKERQAREQLEAASQVQLLALVKLGDGLRDIAGSQASSQQPPSSVDEAIRLVESTLEQASSFLSEAQARDGNAKTERFRMYTDDDAEAKLKTQDQKVVVEKTKAKSYALPRKSLPIPEAEVAADRTIAKPYNLPRKSLPASLAQASEGIHQQNADTHDEAVEGQTARADPDSKVAERNAELSAAKEVSVVQMQLLRQELSVAKQKIAELERAPPAREAADPVDADKREAGMQLLRQELSVAKHTITKLERAPLAREAGDAVVADTREAKTTQKAQPQDKNAGRAQALKKHMTVYLPEKSLKKLEEPNQYQVIDKSAHGNDVKTKGIAWRAENEIQGPFGVVAYRSMDETDGCTNASIEFGQEIHGSDEGGGWIKTQALIDITEILPKDYSEKDREQIQKALNDRDIDKTLMELLGTNEKVGTKLNLHDESINDAKASVLAEAINRAQTFAANTVIFSRNEIGDEGAKSIVEALKGNTTVTSINFVNNRISDQGAGALAEVLETNQTIKEIKLGVNHIGDGGAARLAQALEKNTTLETVFLNENKIGDVGAEALVEALMKNTAIKRFSLAKNKLSVNVLKKLQEAKNKKEKEYIMFEPAEKQGGMLKSLAVCGG